LKDIWAVRELHQVHTPLLLKNILQYVRVRHEVALIE
jgi:hypothetical protein